MIEHGGRLQRLSDSVLEELSYIHEDARDIEDEEFYRLIGVWFGQDFIDIYKDMTRGGVENG